MSTRSSAVSCGTTLFYNLSSFRTLRDLNAILMPEYIPWGTRFSALGVRNAVEQNQGISDGKLYKCETVIFSDADAEGNGKRIARAIKRYKLGEVVSIRTENPNTSRIITTYLWVYNGNKINRTTKKVTK